MSLYYIAECPRDFPWIEGLYNCYLINSDEYFTQKGAREYCARNGAELPILDVSGELKRVKDVLLTETGNFRYQLKIQFCVLLCSV